MAPSVTYRKPLRKQVYEKLTGQSEAKSEPSVSPKLRQHARNTSLTLNLIDGTCGGTVWRPKEGLPSTSTFALIGLIVFCSTISGLMGYEIRGHDKGSQIQRLSEYIPSSPACNPYDNPGYLQVNLTTPGENKWVPVGVPESCEPKDWMDAIRRRSPEVEFMKNRSIILFGDSVDRDHNEHMCALAGGERFMVGPEHPFSPPLPRGQEQGPQGYKNPFFGTREWPVYTESRPFICYFDHLNTIILNVFPFGYQDETPWILTTKHYYPPAKAEERFEDIVLPLYERAAKHFGLSPVPDVVSVAPGFWTIMRLNLEKNLGVDWTTDDDEVFQDRLNIHVRDWLSKRTMQLIDTVARGWNDAEKKPLLLWRTLHHIRRHDWVPYEQTQALDGLSRGIIQRMAASSTPSAGLRGLLPKQLPFRRRHKKRSIPLELDKRLKIDNWGSIMLGQERHFRDNIHPLPLPGSYVYGNGIIEALRIDLETRRAPRNVLPNLLHRKEK